MAFARHRRAAERASGQRVHPFARPWTLAAWVFLTLGIVPGSRAYYELGWAAGGSGTRWRTPPYAVAGGTALLHSLAVTEQRAGFKGRGRCCCPSAPSRCACWAPSPVRPGCWCRCTPASGPGARNVYPPFCAGHRRPLPLLAVRGHRVRLRVNNALQSRESLLLGNNVLLMAALCWWCCWAPCQAAGAQTSWGWAAFRWGAVFNTMFTGLMVPLPCCWGGALVRWGRTGRVTSGNCCSPPPVSTGAVGTFAMAAGR